MRSNPVRAIAIAIAALLIGAWWGLARNRDVDVVVTIPDRAIGPLSGQLDAGSVLATGTGVGEAPIPPGAAAAGAVKATGRVSFGRGYGSLNTAPPPFSRLVVRRGAVVWFCTGPNPDGPPPCPAGPKFETLADAVIRPGNDDCFLFACNAGSECVPAVALTAGELGNVPSQRGVNASQTGFGTNARADDGQQVFVSWCETTTVGTGAPTERARAEANKNVALDPIARSSGAVVVVREVKETISFEPATDYPPTIARVSLKVREGGVARTDLVAEARRAIRREAGAGWEIVEDTWHLETTPKPDEFAVGYAVRAGVSVDKSAARRRIIRAIAGLSPSAAREAVRRLFPGAAVEVKTPPDKSLPKADRLRVSVRTT